MVWDFEQFTWCMRVWGIFCMGCLAIKLLCSVWPVAGSGLRLASLGRLYVKSWSLCLIYCPRMRSSALIPFLGALGSLINPFKQKRAPFLIPRLLGNLVFRKFANYRRSTTECQGLGVTLAPSSSCQTRQLPRT